MYLFILLHYNHWYHIITSTPQQQQQDTTLYTNKPLPTTLFPSGHIAPHSSTPTNSTRKFHPASFTRRVSPSTLEQNSKTLSHHLHLCNFPLLHHGLLLAVLMQYFEPLEHELSVFTQYHWLATLSTFSMLHSHDRFITLAFYLSFLISTVCITSTFSYCHDGSGILELDPRHTSGTHLRSVHLTTQLPHHHLSYQRAAPFPATDNVLRRDYVPTSPSTIVGPHVEDQGTGQPRCRRPHSCFRPH